ncbi:MAG: HIT domain-containing protein [Verrucomicrobia bacterium]|nr:HIT domain-containing protein [Verrucomicrobiota bacterium]
MEHLWAPWRMQYIQTAIKNKSNEGCIFCVKPQASDDQKNLIILRDKTCFALMNLFPYNPGHLMIAPYKHTGELDDLTEAELADLMLLTRRCKRLLTAVIQPQAFNIGINLGLTAGAGITDHLHVHIVPRWNGDTNFMPVIGETKVIPEALDPLYQRLRAGVANLA